MIHFFPRYFRIFYSKVSKKITCTLIRLLCSSACNSISSACDFILGCFQGEVRKKCRSGLIMMFHWGHRGKPMLFMFNLCLCTFNSYFSWKSKMQRCSLILNEYLSILLAAKQAICWGVRHPSLCNNEKYYRGFHSSSSYSFLFLLYAKLQSFPVMTEGTGLFKRNLYLLSYLASGLQILY